MIERLKARLAMREAQVRRTGIEPVHLIAIGHGLRGHRRSYRPGQVRARISTHGALCEDKGGQKKACDELSVFPAHDQEFTSKVDLAPGYPRTPDGAPHDVHQAFLSLSALPTTETELKDIAKAAMSGERRIPKKG